MTSRATTYFANAILDHISGVLPFTAPAGLYLGLFASDPTDAGLFAGEFTAPSYSRVLVDFDPASSRQANSNALAEFPVALESWGTATHWALMNAATSGQMLLYGTLQDANEVDTPRIVQAGDIVRFNAGTVSIEVD